MAVSEWESYPWGDGTTANNNIAYPDTIPDTLRVQIGNMEAQASNILAHSRIPYALIAKLAALDYVTLTDIGQRFGTTLDTVNRMTADELKLGVHQTDGLNYNQPAIMRYLRRFVAASETCRTVATNNGQSQAVSLDPSLLVPGQAKQLRAGYKHVEGINIPLEHEGSECFVKKQLHFTQMENLAPSRTNKLYPLYQTTPSRRSASSRPHLEDGPPPMTSSAQNQTRPSDGKNRCALSTTP